MEWYGVECASYDTKMHLMASNILAIASCVYDIASEFYFSLSVSFEWHIIFLALHFMVPYAILYYKYETQYEPKYESELSEIRSRTA